MFKIYPMLDKNERKEWSDISSRKDLYYLFALTIGATFSCPPPKLSLQYVPIFLSAPFVQYLPSSIVPPASSDPSLYNFLHHFHMIFDSSLSGPDCCEKGPQDVSILSLGH